jgi:hypothetical protein
MKTSERLIELAKELHELPKYSAPLNGGLCLLVPSRATRTLKLFRPEHSRSFWWQYKDKDTRVLALCFIAAMVDDVESEIASCPDFGCYLYY